MSLYDHIDYPYVWEVVTRTLRVKFSDGLANDYELARRMFATGLAWMVYEARERGEVPRVIVVESGRDVLETLPATLLEAMEGQTLEGTEDNFVALLAEAWRLRWKVSDDTGCECGETP